MAIRTALTEMFGLRHPIVLAPMGAVSGGGLAAAVSEAGGLGLIGVGYADSAWLDGELAAAGNRPVGVGFITWQLEGVPDQLDLALDRGAKAVMFSFGNAAPFVQRARQAGVPALCQVQTLAQACEAAAWGADLIVAQGGEAGGHGLRRATFPLVPAVVDAVAPVPVVAAGGVADGRGLAAALMLGAAGVLVGTRFFATEEALAHPDAKARLVGASGDDTLRTTVFDTVRGIRWPGAYTGRAIANATSARWHGREAELAADPAPAMARHADAVKRGDFSEALVYAGEDVDLIADIPPAGALVERIAHEAEMLLKAAAGRCDA